MTAAAERERACYHCRQPNPPGSRWRVVLEGRERAFCCAGCLGIAQAIHGAGLEAFYRQRTAAGITSEPDAQLAAEVARWDEPSVQSGFVRTTIAGHAEVSLLLEGIHCGACTWLIETWLAREPGVTSASVNYATRRARVVWDPAQGRLSTLLRAVSGIGYRAFPYDPDRREALARRESRTLLLRMAVAMLAMMQVMMFTVPTYVTIDGVEPIHQRLLDWASLTLTLPALLYGAWPFFRGAWRDIAVRRPGMDVPVAIGIAAAFGASAWATLTGGGSVYYDSITMFIALLLLARYVELSARRRAGDAVETVARARPVTAERCDAWPSSADTTAVTAASLVAGDVVLVRPGSVVPADGVVVDGAARVDEAILTGEANPLAKATGDALLAGSVARDGALTVRVTAASADTRLAAIERLVERAAGERPHAARVADRVATWFVAVLLAIAAATAIAWLQVDPSRALAVTFAVLAVSCPCALSLATPAAIAAGSGALSRRNVVLARADAAETLARTTHLVLDKTGTLTEGRLALVSTSLCSDVSAALALAAAMEAQSEHPLARALREAGAGLAWPVLASLRTVPGQGVEAWLDGGRVRLGRPDFVAALTGASTIAAPAGIDPAATLVALGDDVRGTLALFAFNDPLRPGARALIERVHGLGIATLLLSGDRAPAVEALRARLGIMQARGDASPEDKRAAIAALQAQGAVVAMVGDGINDAPSLAQAQVSVSLGSATTLAQWTADVVVLADDLPRIADTIAHAKRTMAVVRQNLAWAFVYNAIAIPAAALGFVTPLLAALGMSVSSMVVVLNALRAARFARTRQAEEASEGIAASAGAPRAPSPRSAKA